MPIRNYGVWRAKLVSYTVDGPDDQSPHINLIFSDNQNLRLKAAVNVKSQTHPSELVYWFDHDFTHPLTHSLEDLEYGFHPIDHRDHDSGRYALDFYRTRDLLVLGQGRVLPYLEDGPDNDIIDQLEPLLDAAKRGSGTEEADVYLFGSQFNTGDGIHNIHMNQGSKERRFRGDNGVGTDGALVFRFPNGKWKAVFLAFASRYYPTDNAGQPTSSGRQLARILGAGGRSRL